MRQTWHEASLVQLGLEQQGRPTTPQDLWREMGNEPPVPRMFVTALESESYSQLLDIRRRTLVVPHLEELGLVSELASKGAYMAMTLLLEDLATIPHRISVSEKRQTVKVLSELHEKLKGKEGVSNPVLSTAIEEEQQMEAALAQVPEAYRDHMREVWKEERIRELRKTHAMHIVKEVEGLGNANTG